MSQTILIEPNDDLRKIFSLNLNTFVGTDVIIRKNALEAIELLKILPEISLVIAKNKLANEETAMMLRDFIKDQQLDTSLIVLGECPPVSGEHLCLAEPVNWEILIRQAASHLGVTLKEATQKIRADFLPVGLYYFYDITHTPCDVYIRIKKGPNDYQFVKRIHSKDTFDKQDIKRYEEQGLLEFFVPKDYIQYFTTFVTNALIQKLERDDLSLEDRILTTSNAHEIIRENVPLMGFDEPTIELTDVAIKSMITSIKNSPQVSSLLKLLFSNKVSYAYQHCHLLALMCHYVLSKQSWYKPEHLEILSFAAFFSDITLKSTQQIQISSMREVNLADFTDEDRDNVMNHARDAISLLNNNPSINDYVKTVIMQSHGNPDGLGFVDDPEENLHPLAKVFIIADTFVKILLNPHLPSTKKDILPMLMARFTQPSYHKIIKALEQKFE